MAFAFANRVKETTATQGTGTYSLAGAKTGFQGFVAGCGSGSTVAYCCTDGVDWEVGLGVVTDASPDTITRATIIESSNGNAAVNWGAGTKDVFCVNPALGWWEDLCITPSAFDFAGNTDPSLTDWQPGGTGVIFKVWAFEKNDEAFFTAQFPHAYKTGTDVDCHVHWTPRNRGALENGQTVAWKLAYSWAGIGAAFAASAVVNMTDTCSGTDHLHEISPVATISGAGKGISSMLVGRIYRDNDDNWAGTGAAGSPVLLEIDFHYQQDTLGSEYQLTK